MGKTRKPRIPRRPTPEELAVLASRESIVKLAEDVLQHPHEWLETPNSQFGGRKPSDLFDTPQAIKLYYLLRAVDLEMFS